MGRVVRFFYVAVGDGSTCRMRAAHDCRSRSYVVSRLFVVSIAGNVHFETMHAQSIQELQLIQFDIFSERSWVGVQETLQAQASRVASPASAVPRMDTSPTLAQDANSARLRTPNTSPKVPPELQTDTVSSPSNQAPVDNDTKEGVEEHGKVTASLKNFHAQSQAESLGGSRMDTKTITVQNTDTHAGAGSHERRVSGKRKVASLKSKCASNKPYQQRDVS